METTPLLPRTESADKPTDRYPCHFSASSATAPPKTYSPLKPYWATALICLFLVWLNGCTPWGWRMGDGKCSLWPYGFDSGVVEAGTDVPLEVHIMSKCPDAKLCLQELVIPAMANVSDKVDFRLSFIGKTTEEDDGVQCPHGQTECLGDIILLCAASVYPDPKINLGFTGCLIRDYQQIPKKELIQDCALEHGMSFDKLNDCMSEDNGAYGMGMLRESVTRSHDLNVTTSCTVRLNNETRCITDGGKFQNCEGGSKPEDLIHDIERLYRKGE